MSASVEIPNAVLCAAQAGNPSTAGGGTARHLVVKRELLSSSHAACCEEGNPLQALVQILDPDWKDDQVGVALERGGGGDGKVHRLSVNLTT